MSEDEHIRTWFEADGINLIPGPNGLLMASPKSQINPRLYKKLADDDKLRRCIYSEIVNFTSANVTDERLASTLDEICATDVSRELYRHKYEIEPSVFADICDGRKSISAGDQDAALDSVCVQQLQDLRSDLPSFSLCLNCRLQFRCCVIGVAQA